MDNRFFEKPILNSPYEYPARHWELDGHGQPTQRIIERHRSAEFITPIPKPRKRKDSPVQQQIIFIEILKNTNSSLTIFKQKPEIAGAIHPITDCLEELISNNGIL